MEAADLIECLRLLDAADSLLVASDEFLLSARLMAAVEPLRARARDLGLGEQLDGLGHGDRTGAGAGAQL